MLSRGEALDAELSYDVFINSACNGCSCILCPYYIIAKPEFDKITCAEECPQGSVKFKLACLGVCPYGNIADDTGFCYATLCDGY